MELTGKLVAIGDITEGQSARGTWRKQIFAIETMEQYPKKVAFMAWGDRCDDVAVLNLGDTLTVQFDVESREFNGKWYTDLKAWSIKGAQSQGAPTQIQNPPQQPLPPMQQAPQFDMNEGNNGDDLPF